MQRVLGLDVGSFAIKAVLIEHDYEKYKIIDYAYKELPFIQGDEYKIRRDIIQNMLKDLGKHGFFEVVYTGVPATSVSCRRLKFLNVKKKDLPLLIGSELENVCQFDVEEFLVETEDLASRNSNEHLLLTFLCPKTIVKNFLSFLSELSLSPKTIDIDGNAFTNLTPFITTTHQDVVKKGSFAIIDIGHQKSNIAIFEKGQIKNLVSIDVGGKLFTQDLCENFELDFEDAEMLKKHVSLLYNEDLIKEYNFSEKETLISKQILASSYTLTGEIQRILQMQKLIDDCPIDLILLTGGASQTKGIIEFIESQVGIKTRKLEVQNDILGFKDPAWAFSTTLFTAASYGLRSFLSPSNSTVNFRKGEMAVKSDYQRIVNQISFGFAAFVVIVIVLFATYSYRNSHYQTKIAEIQSTFDLVLNDIIKKQPTLRAQLMPLKNLPLYESGPQIIKLVENQISREENVLSQFFGPSLASPLTVIESFSRHVPKDVHFEVVGMEINGDQLTVNAETNETKNVSKIVDLIKKEENLFSSLKIEKQHSKPGTDDKIISFSFRGTLIKKQGT